MIEFLRFALAFIGREFGARPFRDGFRKAA
jgi:hypothetical protein